VSRPALELAEIFRRHGPEYRRRQELPMAHLRVMRAIETCRTAALGGHVERCDRCAFERIAYNSCRNRHCPKCQTAEKLEWLQQRQQELLPISYFHVVFTVPEPIAAIALRNKKAVLQILFRASAETLLTIAADPKHLGADIGFFSILHTWGQNLLFHPHVHCVVTGGGLSPDGERWVASRPDFFLSVRVLSHLFRRLFLTALQQAHATGQLTFPGQLASLADPQAFAAYLAPLGQQDWVVHAKPPFGGARQVIDYLGRYTHRVALSNQRLLAIGDDTVTFQYKDYRSAEPQQSRSMTLEADEFIRRFLLHVLPDGFQRIRYYGLLANRFRAANLEQCRTLLHGPRLAILPASHQFQQMADSTIRPATPCPRCRQGVMVRGATIAAIRWTAPAPDSS
jgi:hypothetical protein